MRDHVTIRASDRSAYEAFYETVLPTIGNARENSGREYTEWGHFSVAHADAERPVTRGLHNGLAAPSQEPVDEFWRAGSAAGYRDDAPPGPRPQYPRGLLRRLSARPRRQQRGGRPPRRAARGLLD